MSQRKDPVPSFEKKIRTENLIRSVFITGTIFYCFYFFFWDGSDRGDETLLIFAFVISQTLMGFFSAILIILRLMGIFKNRNARLYQFAGIFQISLMVADAILFLVCRNLDKNTMLFFFGLNLLFGLGILRDIYRNTNYLKK